MKKARRASPDGEGREQNPAPETGIANRKKLRAEKKGENDNRYTRAAKGILHY
jgi:hypothetical protein